MDHVHKMLLSLKVPELHQAILNKRFADVALDHGDLERACTARIAAIPRLPLSRDGRWWHYPNAHGYPFGN